MDESEEARRVEALKRYGIMDTPRETVFDEIVREASLLTGSPASTITMVDGERQWFKAETGVGRQGSPIDQSICAVAMFNDGAFVVDDLAGDARFSGLDAVVQDGFRFYAGVPLAVDDGTRVGTLCVIDTSVRAGLSGDERATLEALARRTVAALETRRELLADGRGTLDDQAWRGRARTLLDQAAAALTQIGATAALAQLETVIAMIGNEETRDVDIGPGDR